MKRIQKTPSYEKRTGKKLKAPIRALYDAMHESKLTYAQVESISGVSDSAVNRWFNEGVIPSVDFYCAVAEALGYRLEIVKDD